MSAPSIRRAVERQQKKLARKAEKAAHAVAAEIPPVEPAELFSEPNPELLGEFTPEFIAEANALREKIERKAGLLLGSEPRPQASGRVSATQLDSVPRTSASGRIS